MRYFDRLLHEALDNTDPSKVGAKIGDKVREEKPNRPNKREEREFYALMMRWKNLQNEQKKAKQEGKLFEKMDVYFGVEEEMREYIRKYPESARQIWARVIDTCPDKEELEKKLMEIHRTRGDNLITWMLRYLVNKAEQG
jgi:hypothetical protein